MLIVSVKTLRQGRGRVLGYLTIPPLSSQCKLPHWQSCVVREFRRRGTSFHLWSRGCWTPFSVYTQHNPASFPQGWSTSSFHFSPMHAWLQLFFPLNLSGSTVYICTWAIDQSESGIMSRSRSEWLRLHIHCPKGSGKKKSLPGSLITEVSIRRAAHGCTH